MLNQQQKQLHSWFAVHTKPRQEHVAEDNLRRQGFECYCPRAENPKRRLKSRVSKAEALFSRYLFIKANETLQNLGSISYTRGVSNLLCFGDELARVPDRVIENLKQSTDLETGLVRLQPVTFKQGDQVEIFEGSLAGVKAVYESADGSLRAMLLVDLLGRESRVSVDTAALRYAR